MEKGESMNLEDQTLDDGGILLQIGGIVRESIVDGPGIRMTVFTQGCTHNCPGCHNQPLQPFEGGTCMTVAEIMAQARANPLLDGITLSGGEPFQQAVACAALARSAKAAGLHVMAYTGYLFEDLLAVSMKDRTEAGPSGWKELLVQLDILVDGPFMLSQRDLLLRFRGSANQRLIDVPASLKACAAIGLSE